MTRFINRFLLPLCVCACSVLWANAKSLSVPAAFDGGYAYVHVSLEGQPVWLGIDTGTNPSALDIRLAKRLRLHLNRTRAGLGIGQSVKEEESSATVSLGSIVQRHVAFDIADISGSFGHTPVPVEGNLGYSFLKGRIVRIDYRKRTVSIGANSGAKSSCFAERFPFRLDAGVPSVRIVVNHHPIRAIIDTGGNYFLLLNPSILTHVAAGGDYNAAKDVGANGYGGGQQIRSGNVDSLEIGSRRLGHALTAFSTFGAQNPFHFDRAALGNMVFAGRVLTLDYVHNAATLSDC